MHLPVILFMALATWVGNIQASPVSIRSSARHPPQVLEAPDKLFARHARQQDIDAVSSRADDDDSSMSGILRRDFDVVSPPSKVLPPRSDDAADASDGDYKPPKVIPRSGEEFSMSGKLSPLHKVILSRADGITSAGDFEPFSPPPKIRPSQSRISRRQNVWTSGFIRNLINKFTGQSPTKPVPGSGSTSSGLTPCQQNGPSKYGIPEMETLPKYYGGGSETLWGTITTTNANPYKSCPQTGATRSYDFTVAECDIRPDGVETKRAVCVNGQFPGPLIEANYGDMIQVKVTNKLHEKGTSMHWHGFLQTGTNQMDGVPGVTQCAIAPNATMTYTFRAELYGTAWYHTHYSAQYAGGAVGPMVIYGPTNTNADIIDLGPVMLSDWYRNDYMTNIRGLMRPISEGGPINPLTNSNLINGKMRFPCSKTNLKCDTADYSTFKFTSGKNHLLRLVNTGSNAVQKFAIDGHSMQVISNDFMPVEPYNTSMLALGVGQRAEVIVYGLGKPTDKVWMRSNIVAWSINDGQLTEALGVVYYEGADTKTIPTAGLNEGPAADTSPRWCGNDPLTVTVPSFPLKASEPAITKHLDIRMKNNGTHMLLNFGDNSFRANFNDPLLGKALSVLSTISSRQETCGTLVPRRQ